MQPPLGISNDFYIAYKIEFPGLRNTFIKTGNIIIVILVFTGFLILVYLYFRLGADIINNDQIFKVLQIIFIIGGILLITYEQTLKYKRFKDENGYMAFISKEAIRQRIMVLIWLLVTVVVFKEWLFYYFMEIVYSSADTLNTIMLPILRPILYFLNVKFYEVSDIEVTNEIRTIIDSIINHQISMVSSTYKDLNDAKSMLKSILSRADGTIINFIIILLGYDLLITLISKSIYLKRGVWYYLKILFKTGRATIILILIIFLAQHIMEIQKNALSDIMNQPFILGLYFTLILSLYDEDSDTNSKSTEKNIRNLA